MDFETSNISLPLETTFGCLHPELLDIEKLVAILVERNVSKSDLLALEKHELVELFYRHVLPLPQRRYRQNRRGREMAKSQILVSKRSRQTQAITPDEPQLKKSRSDMSDTQTTSGLINVHLTPSSAERLKPPPSAINFSRKTLKLNSSNSISTNSTSTCSSSSSDTKSSSSVIRISTGSETDASADDKMNVVRLKPPPTSSSSSISLPSSQTSSVSPPTCRESKSGVLKTNAITIINRHLSQDGTASCHGRTANSKPSIKDTSTTSATTTAAADTVTTAAATNQGTESAGKKFKISRISWP